MTKKKACKTPGAWFHCHALKPNAVGQTHINMGVTLPMPINEKQARRIEKEFHNKLEDLLAFLWEKPIGISAAKPAEPTQGDAK